MYNCFNSCNKKKHNQAQLDDTLFIFALKEKLIQNRINIIINK